MDGIDVFADIAGEFLTTAAVSNDDKDKKGCFIFFLIAFIFIGGYFVYEYYSEPVKEEPIKGVVIYKMSDNHLLVRTKNGEEVFYVSEELYNNKNVNDSIMLSKINK